MHEGPEIRRAADALAAAVVGVPLTGVEFAFPALKRYEPALIGHRIEAILPRGKALLTRFDNGLTLYSHNQLYGVWKIVASGARPATTRSLRVALETAKKAILLYSASDVAIWPTGIDAHASVPAPHRSGRARSGGVVDPSTNACCHRHSAAAPFGAADDQSFLAAGQLPALGVLFRARTRRSGGRVTSTRKNAGSSASATRDSARELLTHGIRRARGMRATTSPILRKDSGSAYSIVRRSVEACGTPIQPAKGGRRLVLVQSLPEVACREPPGPAIRHNSRMSAAPCRTWSSLPSTSATTARSAHSALLRAVAARRRRRQWRSAC